jgi:hypothetical protein
MTPAALEKLQDRRKSEWRSARIRGCAESAMMPITGSASGSPIPPRRLPRTLTGPNDQRRDPAKKHKPNYQQENHVRSSFRFQRSPGLYPGLSCLKLEYFAQEPASSLSVDRYRNSAYSAANSRLKKLNVGGSAICYDADNGIGVRPIPPRRLPRTLTGPNDQRRDPAKEHKPNYQQENHVRSSSASSEGPGPKPGLSCLKLEYLAQEPASSPSVDRYRNSAYSAADSRRK